MISHGDDIYKYPNIRLNFSSNVYNHFDHSGLFRHLSERMEVVTSYPEPTPFTLERRLAEKLGLKPENVMVTNGATEAIYLIAQAYRGSTSHILQPTFSEYEEACRLAGHTIVSTDRQDIPDSCQMMWLCNPNNPTGQVMEINRIIDAIKKHPDTLFVVDSSYALFTDLPLILPKESARYKNVLMLNSMTKGYAIPGLRLGYVTGEANLMKKLNAGRMPWSVNALAIEAGLYLLAHDDEYKIDIDTLMAERQRVAEALTETGKIETCPSDTHILLCRLKEGAASDLKEHLARQGILIRDASNFTTLDDSFFRIAVQSKEENDELVHAIGSVVSHI